MHDMHQIQQEPVIKPVAIFKAAKEQNLELLEELLKTYLEQHPYFIFDAVCVGNLQLIECIHKVKPSLLYEPDADGYTPLHHAVDKQHIDVAKFLMQHDETDIYAPNNRGWSPIALALFDKNRDMLEAILDSVSTKDDAEKCKLLKYITTINDQFGCSPLMHVALDDRPDIIGLLVRHGVDIDYKYQFCGTVLHYGVGMALLYPDTWHKFIPNLLMHGASLSAENDNNKTPIDTLITIIDGSDHIILPDDIRAQQLKVAEVCLKWGGIDNVAISLDNVSEITKHLKVLEYADRLIRGGVLENAYGIKPELIKACILHLIHKHEHEHGRVYSDMLSTDLKAQQMIELLSTVDSKSGINGLFIVLKKMHSDYMAFGEDLAPFFPLFSAAYKAKVVLALLNVSSDKNANKLAHVLEQLDAATVSSPSFKQAIKIVDLVTIFEVIDKLSPAGKALLELLMHFEVSLTEGMKSLNIPYSNLNHYINQYIKQHTDFSTQQNDEEFNYNDYVTKLLDACNTMAVTFSDMLHDILTDPALPKLQELQAPRACYTFLCNNPYKDIFRHDVFKKVIKNTYKALIEQEDNHTQLVDAARVILDMLNEPCIKESPESMTTSGVIRTTDNSMQNVHTDSNNDVVTDSENDVSLVGGHDSTL